MLQLYVYRIKSLVKTPELVFWSFIFPILLGTMFNLAFGNIAETTESFKSIPVAVVKEKGQQEEFLKVVKAAADADEPLLKPQYVDEKKAKKLLEDQKVDGIIHAGQKLTLQVSAEDIEQSLLKSFLDQYLQTESTIKKIMKSDPSKINDAVAAISENLSFTKEQPSVSGNMDNFIQYFYALIAMACLYGCFYGLATAGDLQANISALGIRRGVSPTKKGYMTAVDFLASVSLHFSGLLVLFFYLTVVLGKSFGDRWPLILLVMLVGCMAGIGFGMFVGAALRKPMGVKVAVALSVTMVMCFCSGLMMGNMKDIIEHYAPILNRINPAALISDSLYCLNVYVGYETFAQRMGLLTAISLIFVLGSSLILRRKRYASL